MLGEVYERGCKLWKHVQPERMKQWFQGIGQGQGVVPAPQHGQLVNTLDVAPPIEGGPVLDLFFLDG